MSTAPETDFNVAEFAKHFDHHSTEYGQHLYDIYEHMRSECPVSHTDKYDGFWVLTKYEDIMRVARDDETFSSEQGITIQDQRAVNMPKFFMKNFGAFVKNLRYFLVDLPQVRKHKRPNTVPIDYDPPRSKQFRSILDPLVSPKAIKAMEPDITKLAIELTDKFIERGEADLALELAQPLTGMVTIKMTGLPVEDWNFYAEPLHKSIWGIGNPEDHMMDALLSQKALAGEVEAQRRKPKEEGIISYLMGCEIEGRKLENWEIEAIIRLFIVGGVDTTQALLSSAWVYFGRNTDRRQEVMDNIDNMTEAVEEMLRYFAPQQALCRTATRDVEIGGKQIKKGEKVLMCWASANRDPSEFENPTEIDFNRSHNRHMTFGVGSHRCMGSNLARLEAKVCMEQVLTRLPDYKLVEDGVRFAPDVGTVYGYSAVPVTFTPGKKQLS